MPIDALWILGWGIGLLVAFIVVLYRKYSGFCASDWQKIKAAYQEELNLLDSDYYKRRDNLEIRYRNKFRALEKQHHCSTQRILYNILLVFLAANLALLHLNISTVLQAVADFEWRIKPLASQSSPHTFTAESTVPISESATASHTPATYAFTVMANPTDSQIWILNIRPRYTAGMQLKPGTYTVKIAKMGYKTRVIAVDVESADVVVYIHLEKV